MTRRAARAAALLVACAALVFAAGAAEAREVEEPPRVMTLAINSEDAVPAEVQQRLAGQRPAGEFILHCSAEGAVDRIEEVKTIAGCETFLRDVLARQCHRISPAAPYRARQTIELSFRPAPAPAGATATPTAAKYKNVPPFQFDAQKISGDMPHLPDLVKIQHKGEQLVGMYKVCVAPDGNVASIATVQPIPDANGVILDAIKTWKLKPQPQGICTLLRFVFTLSGGRFR